MIVYLSDDINHCRYCKEIPEDCECRREPPQTAMWVVIALLSAYVVGHVIAQIIRRMNG